MAFVSLSDLFHLHIVLPVNLIFLPKAGYPSILGLKIVYTSQYMFIATGILAYDYIEILSIDI